MMLRLISKLTVLLVCAPLVAQAEGQTSDELAALHSKIVDKTYRIEQSDGAVHVLYFGADGRVFEWVPGRFDVRVEVWRPKQVIGVQWAGHDEKRVGLVDAVCVGRAPNSTGPVTFDTIRVPRNGPCRSWADMNLATLEQAEGDVLNLRSGTAPCRLCRTTDTLAKMRR